MTFLIAMTIGIATGAMRSILSIMMVSLMLLIGGVMLLATSSSFTVMDLLMALIGYQVGLIDCLFLALVLSNRAKASLNASKTTESPIADHPARL